MGLLTEPELRELLRGENLEEMKEFRVAADTLVTPAAREYLLDHKIELVYEGGDNGNLPTFQKPARYRGESGEVFPEKPEHMTALRGTTLVNKDHPAIVFRGKLDSLQARILETALAMQRLGMPRAADDLQEILLYTRQLLRCEVLDSPLEETPLLGMGLEEIRARSHTPKQYYGMNHFAIGLEHGEGVILLNTLRTQVREVELAAYAAFKGEDGVPRRDDLIRGLNRLSSLFYIMMFKVLAKEYGE